ncbi:unnamed protein product [Rotaria sp. Silwood2]|nr:unnamed protein product [Rotaria sp. Silwood2]CAF3951039.1 unnamed protein product [Rotaria sp. Silwood2]
MIEIEVHEKQCGQQLGNCPTCNCLIAMRLLQQHRMICTLINIERNLQALNQFQNLPQPTYALEPNYPMQHNTLPLENTFYVTTQQQAIQERYRNFVWWRRTSLDTVAGVSINNTAILNCNSANHVDLFYLRADYSTGQVDSYLARLQKNGICHYHLANRCVG